jgi:glucosyl-3-phosphoglycerate synthase
MTPRLASGAAATVEEWFERRSYHHSQFVDLELLAKSKRDRDLSLSVVLPAREVATTVGPIIDDIRALGERAPLVDQLLVIDADSQDGTADVAARHGAEVHRESELLTELGAVAGKGDAMWRALSLVRGDLVMYLDSDTLDFGPHFVYGLLGPLLTVPQLRFVKGTYSRSLRDAAGVEIDDGGRVTELTARPLFNLFYPALTGFSQPLAGELVAPRDLLTSIPFFSGYAVETGMLIDVLDAVGLDAMAQVDLGTRTNRNQRLLELSRMSYEVVLAVERRAMSGNGSVHNPHPDVYVHAVRSESGLALEQRTVEVLERPPLREVLAR